MANRNAFYYLLDRETGEFLHASPYAKQTWAKGIDDRGRPQCCRICRRRWRARWCTRACRARRTGSARRISPAAHLFYVPVREMGAYYYKTEAEYKPGNWFGGGGERPLSGDAAMGPFARLDVNTGAQKWEFRLKSPPWAGVLSTAGGLVFGGSNEGNFYALDGMTGKPLWDFQTGGGIVANPVSFLIDGKQHVAIAAGQAVLVFGL